MVGSSKIDFRLSIRLAEERSQLMIKWQFYHQIYSLLQAWIASQVIYAETLRDVWSILNQVMQGLLAKLGNLRFVLAEPLEVTV